VLTKKAFNVGFREVEVVERRPVGIDALARYPVVRAELEEFLRQALPVARHQTLVWAIVVTARKPAGG
jgi:hypothetical protein